MLFLANSRNSHVYSIANSHAGPPLSRHACPKSLYSGWAATISTYLNTLMHLHLFLMPRVPANLLKANVCFVMLWVLWWHYLGSVGFHRGLWLKPFQNHLLHMLRPWPLTSPSSCLPGPKFSGHLRGGLGVWEVGCGLHHEDRRCSAKAMRFAMCVPHHKGPHSQSKDPSEGGPCTTGVSCPDEDQVVRSLQLSGTQLLQKKHTNELVEGSAIIYI